MADVLSVIADVLKQDKQQKREHNKIMKEVQKKLKEKGSEEVAEEEGDKEDYMKFFAGKLKKYGVKSPAELSDEDKKKFFSEIEKDWTHDSNEEVEEKGSLGSRVKARMEAEEGEEEDENPFEKEDEDDDPVGDPDEDEAEEEPEGEDEPEGEGEDEPDPDEVEGEKLDRLADLVIQKLKDKASDEDEEMNAPDETEAEQGEEEEIEQNPKVESVDIHRNPHSRKSWAEALRKVYQTEEKKNLEEAKVPAPIPEVIKSVGKQLRDYALKSGGIDKGDFLKVSDEMQKGKIPKASLIPSDTEPREFVHDLMAKTFGWKFVEQEYGITFLRRRDYVESFQGGHKLQEHCGECEMGLQEEVSEKDFDALKKGDTITIEFKSSMSTGKSTFKVTAKNIVGKAKVHKATLQNVKNPKSVKFFLYKRGNKVSLAQGDMAASVVKYTVEEVELDEIASTMYGIVKGTQEKGKVVFKGSKRTALKKLRANEFGPNTILINSPSAKVGDKWGKGKTESVEIDEGTALQVKMALSDVGLKGTWKNNKVYVKKKDVKKAEKALKGNVIYKGKPPEVVAEEMIQCPECDQMHDKGECPMTEEVIKEDWFDNEVKKVEKKWMSKDKRGKYTMNKRAKMNWIDKIEAKADQYDMTDFELEDALDDYGISVKLKDYDKDGGYTKDALKRYPQTEETNLEKLEKWGIKVQKEGYSILPAIDRERYDEMRGLEGPFMTRSGKVLYYDPKAGMYYDRDSDIYVSYDAYLEYDMETGGKKINSPFDDPATKEYKKMMRDKKKAEQKAKKNRLKNESIGMRFIRKHSRKDSE